MALALGALLAVTSPARAQVVPNADWRTLATPHFYIHFTPPLEEQARRAAVNAERAWSELATELVPPRGRVDVVLSDAVDFSNGSATPVPTNRIVLYAAPPVAESELRFTDDWNALVITHELTHIFHLDRARGVWALAQHVFGRAPVAFPNLYSPSWLTEGLAVYYESRFTGAGRIRGSEHAAIARAAAIDHRFPAIGSVSLATSRFPFGESAYAYGSLFVDWLARTRGDSTVRRFVESSSAQLVPVLLDLPARSGFGISFSRAWRVWRDSVERSVTGLVAAPLPGWRDLTRDGVFVDAPRWAGDGALLYAGTSGKESYAAWRVDLEGRRSRLGRRNGRSANVPLADGAVLYSQVEYTGPYEVRSDLWVQRPGDAERQLTHGARLAFPDARADGAIVAMQLVPAGTRLVRVSADGRTIVPLTAGGIDEQWTEPRWSARGDRIAAVRWRRGGTSAIVVLDSAGRELRAIASGHAVQATPSWMAGDRAVVYTSDRAGTTDLYAFVLDTIPGLPLGESRLTTSATGLFEPQVGDARTAAAARALLAATRLGADGYHLGVAPLPSTLPAAVLASGGVTPATPVTTPLESAGPIPVPPIGVDSGPARRYSPWRTLAPHYWLPLFGTGVESETTIGATTSGADVIGRHAFAASVLVPTNGRYVIAGAVYQYAGLGLPVLQASASQDVDCGQIGVLTATGEYVCVRRRRIDDAELLATWLRPRARSSLVVAAGGGAERRDYTPIGGYRLPADSLGVFDVAAVPRLVAAASWGNAQRPALSISPEDGVSLGATVRERLRSGFGARGGASTSLVAIARGYKSLDLPGYAHHVVAVRAAAGWSDTRTDAYFEAGGTSGSSIELAPGYTVGEGGRTFGVRGFPLASLRGVRAIGGSVEYRAPLVAPARGLGLLPLFVDKASLVVFGDAARAWCPDAAGGRQVCTLSALATPRTIASLGAELGVQAAVLSWDQPYRLRVGVAHPIATPSDIPRPKPWSIYAAAGFAF